MSFGDSLNQAIRKIHDWYYKERQENDFAHQLFSIFQKANESEFAKLAVIFPIEAQAYSLWLQAKDPIKFFNEYDLKV